jgi:Na+/H+ antiporter NhaC
MEEIRKFVDEMITWAGVTGDFVPMLRHILLTITAILLAMLSDFLCRKILVPLISKITDKTDITWDDVLLNKKVLTSACHIVPAVVIWSLMPLIYLEYPIFKEILERATGIYIVVMSVRTVLVFIGSFKGLENSQERRSSAQQYFHTFCGVLRVLMLFVAAVVVIAILLGKNPMTLFAGLGATSAVLMLVFKDTITGLAAGVRLTSNDMLHKGDWITVKSVDANGIVEDMSLTTVKVRNFDNTIVTISPTTLILTLAWTLKSMTDSLGAAEYVSSVVASSASELQMLLPGIIFLVAGFLAFATGTSWGTFGILIPICIAVFPGADPLRIISISACMAGAVCGDHISPISDTTIMASAGAECKHVHHVSSQLPYALTVACVSFFTFIVAGFTHTLGMVTSAIISWIFGVAMLGFALFYLNKRQKGK